jgi:hypothetical protein
VGLSFFRATQKGTKLQFNVIGTGGLLTQAIVVPIKSASTALARAVVTQEEFLCAVVVTDENGMPVTMTELENLQKPSHFNNQMHSASVLKYG